MTYLALIRGINVSGQKIIRMELLRKSFEAIGLENVQTYVQSGNVIFQSPKLACVTLAKKIQQKILKDFGFLVSIIVKTSEEMEKAIKNNPFLKDQEIDVSKLHVTFLSQASEKGAIRRLEALASMPERYRFCGTEIYLYCPNGYARTKLSNNNLERTLSVNATTRKWKTVRTLYEMSVG